MKNTLDQVEARLQTLIESSAFILPGKSSLVPLAHRLVEAMQDNLQQDHHGVLIGPDLFIIHAHPLMIDQWQNIEAVLASLSAILLESARDIDINFINPPVIRVIPDPKILFEDVYITTTGYNNQGYTAAILPEGDAISPDDKSASPFLNAYLIVDGNKFFALDKSVINIGRRHDNYLVINDPRVSRTHCQLRLIRNAYVLFDLNSTGGTYVNNNRITHQPLKGGDVISLAGVQLIYGEDSDFQDTGRLLNEKTANIKKETPPKKT
jgi:pSer/pThr/pTyr-binding forkhead associated (FHA) protein